MKEKYKNVAFIPVRGGSTSIKNKNIKLINGRPLVYWVLDAAAHCDYIDKIFVSTDSDEIKSTVEAYKSEKVMIISRSKEVSTDTASTESAMLEFSKEYDFKNIVLIQATSPLLISQNLNDGFEKFLKEDVDSVISVVRQKRFIWKEEKNTILPQNYDPMNRPRRQDFNGFLVENGAFYITSRESFMKEGCRISGKIGAVEMPEESYYEIDDPLDWVIVENLLKIRTTKKIGKIKALFMDCDGVLTDGGMYYSENGDELKKFNTKDGMGIELVKDKGIITGIITGEKREIVRRRCGKLKIDELHMGIKDKLSVIDRLIEKYELNYEEIAYIGDDINDLEVIKKVGFGCAVKDSMEIIKNEADYITKLDGGKGAVREVAEVILRENYDL
ncbi:N-acylneuraminate cytidylyltransferase [Clostridium felsineum]|uniref:N-acylneuraminate cytidylyltransferase n=1 Tax=Clostridium felsineum TaxID=36839 RepID=A0A1S8L0C1_9CLOT|nr:N-acylneuraminate cytidylyltransferase [Clostridium felsineum]URZ06313.1 8-amino-3,8-dideoxy-manno-octulosonate cytidylyltransferase [Clostridium felsineum]URZ11348.1 8-amino-3,8-dideoxy-manno-octulosonate cytidylyltransferase [Clostridium felsineum]